MEVVINNLSNKIKSIIKVKRYIKKIAIFKDQIAVMLKNKILIFQQTDENEEEVIKTPKFSLKWEENASLILLTSNHLLVCIENRIQCYSIQSMSELSEREWSFDGDIRYLKVIGGPVNRESLLCGVATGEIFIINIDNQFPVEILNHEIPLKILDISCDRKRLALIDENNDLTIINIKDKEVLLKGVKAKSVSFNTEIEDLVAYWYDGNVFLKTGDFPPSCEKMNGVIVGYVSTKVFLLQGHNNVNILDTSQSISIIRYAEKKEFDKAYKLAMLGSTKEELLFLGFESLTHFDLETALNCFKKLEDIRLINLIRKVEQDLNDKVKENVIRGEILCFKGEYEKAELLFLEKIDDKEPDKKGVKRAIDMWNTLKNFDKSNKIRVELGIGGTEGKSDNLEKQAEWLYNSGKFLEAADMYWLAGKKRKAIEIYGEKGYLEKLIEILRQLNKEENEDLIALCGHYFKLHKNYPYSTEAYLKLGDLKSLVLMNIELEKWEEAFYLAKKSKALLEYAHLQWAEDRIKKDKYKEAQDSYKKAGRIDLSMKLLENLIDNAIYEKRFKDGSQLLVSYSQDANALIKDYNSSDKPDVQAIKLYQESIDLSEILNAFDIVYKYIEEPFSKDLLNTEIPYIFNSCKYILNKMTHYKFNLNFIKGVSLSYVYYATAFLSKQFDAYKTSRFCFEKLNTLNIPNNWRQKIEFEVMTIRSKSYTDADSQLSLCFRCLTNNPIINLNGDKCTVCSNPYIRSSFSYEILPLIEFFPERGIDHSQVVEHLARTPATVNLVEVKNNVVSFSNKFQAQDDVFETKLIEFCESNIGKDDYGKFFVDLHTLDELREADVFIQNNQDQCLSQPVRYFKNRMKDMILNMCKVCFRFFRNEEWENLLAKNNFCCPICKSPAN